ncbi:hypothetical protein A4A49_57134, partial [Nicotiana attenuata]
MSAAADKGKAIDQETPSRGRPASTMQSEIASPPPRNAPQAHTKTEVPKLPEVTYTAFEKQSVDPLAEGSKRFELSQRLQGQLGYYWSAEQMRTLPIHSSIRLEVYYTAVFETLQAALHRLIRKSEPHILERARCTATRLTNGVMIATYIKLSNTNVMKVSSLSSRKVFVPSADTEDAKRLLLPVNQAWDPPSYSQAVEYAKSLGMEFAAPDLDVKLGSAWWLHTVRATNTFQAIECPLPEDNFTESTAVLFSLFCTRRGANFGAHLFAMDQVGEDRWTDFIVNPPAAVNVTSFFA